VTRRGSLLALLALAMTATTRARAGDDPPAAPAVTVARVDTDMPVVALTFDACPTKAGTRGFDHEIVEILRREKVPATIFVSGRWVEKHWEEARALADEPLFELGNHSYRHPPFSRLQAAQVREELAATDRLIAALGRQSVGVRPPFGDWAHWLPAQTSGKPVILWDVVSGDAGGHIGPAGIVARVEAGVRPGSIVIFHINGRGPHTKTALPEIIQRLRARGMEFVRVSDLVGLRGGAIVRARPARYKQRRIPAG
jgi:peptidoglycan/xylan/chitin deacetylase (PgdA/CDA1 family)